MCRAALLPACASERVNDDTVHISSGDPPAPC